MDNTEGTFNYISLCSGVGGLDQGLKLAIPTSRCVAYVEIESAACEVLAQRGEEGVLDCAPIFTDVKRFDGHPWRGVVDCIIGGYPCFVAGTMVLTWRGYIPIESVVIGDLVLTHLGRWRKVTGTMVKRGAPVRRIDAQGVPGIVQTDEHPFYTRKPLHRKWLGNFWPKSGKRRYERQSSEPHWRQCSDIKRGDFIGQVIPPVEENQRSAAFWWLVGRYLACGYRLLRKRGKDRYGRQRATKSKVVIITSGQSKADELDRRIADAGFHACKTDMDKPAVKFVINNSELYDFLEPFGYLAHGKRIPGFALSLNPDLSRAFIDGYLNGDGHYEAKRGWTSNSVSKALALSVALLAQRAYGVVAGVQFVPVKPKKRIEGRVVNQRPYWRVHTPDRNRSAFIDGSYGWKYVRKNRPAGVADVYNIAVEDDESYLADGAIVHNCQPFSVAGKQAGTEDPRHLFPDIARIIREAQPAYCIFENVANHLNIGFDVVARQLQEMGYFVEAGLFSAEEVGAPHKRERLFILAFNPAFELADAAS